MLTCGALGLCLAASAPARLTLDPRLERAASLETAGDAAGARAAYRAILADTRNDTPIRAEALAALASLETANGDYGQAEAHGLEAAQLFARLGNPSRAAWALNRAGVAALQGGRYPAAADLFERAVATTPPTDRDGWAERLGNLGNVFLFLGRYTDAARAYTDALAVTDGHEQTDWARRRRRILWVNQATLHQRLGHLNEALALYRRASNDADLRARERAQALSNLGTLYRRLGDPIKALEIYDRARLEFGRDRDADGEVAVLNNRGIALALDLSQYMPASEVFTTALELARVSGNRRRALVAQLYRGEALRRAGANDRARSDFLDSLREARALGTREEEWKVLLGLARVDRHEKNVPQATQRLREAVQVLETIREDVVAPALRSDFFRDKREVYDELIETSLDSSTAADIFTVMDRSRARAWRERLGLTARVDLATVQRSLRPGTALLEYWHSPRATAVARVTRDRADVFPLQVDQVKMLSALRRLAAEPSERPEALDAEAGSLGAVLMPAALLSPDTQHLVIVPDGALSAVPFEWLHVDGRPLVERAAVSYVPTAEVVVRQADAARSRSNNRPAPPWHHELLAFGDPVFADEPLALDGPARPRLTASAAEVRQIAAMLGGTSSVFLGPDNRKARLLESRRGAPTIVHVASHAMVDPSAPERSHLVFSAPAGSTDADYLFLREAYDLQLKGVELAVLSACETERGDDLPGEGVQSFSRAFLAAGAASTVTTLWRVPDAPTAEFMKAFYGHLQRGASRSEALRETKLAFVRSGTRLANPHFWAAFVLNGDTGPITRALRWRDAGAVAGIFAGILTLVAFFLARRRIAGR